MNDHFPDRVAREVFQRRQDEVRERDPLTGPRGCVAIAALAAFMVALGAVIAWRLAHPAP